MWAYAWEEDLQWTLSASLVRFDVDKADPNLIRHRHAACAAAMIDSWQNHPHP